MLTRDSLQELEANLVPSREAGRTPRTEGFVRRRAPSTLLLQYVVELVALLSYRLTVLTSSTREREELKASYVVELVALLSYSTS